MGSGDGKWPMGLDTLEDLKALTTFAALNTTS
jgi:hypothetical protein